MEPCFCVTLLCKIFAGLFGCAGAAKAVAGAAGASAAAAKGASGTVGAASCGPTAGGVAKGAILGGVLGGPSGALRGAAFAGLSDVIGCALPDAGPVLTAIDFGGTAKDFALASSPLSNRQHKCGEVGCPGHMLASQRCKPLFDYSTLIGR